MVKSLAKSGAEILSELDAADCHMLHMALLLQGELLELTLSTDRDNTVEELGDMLFAITAIAEHSGVELEFLSEVGGLPEKTLQAMVTVVEELCSQIKKVAIYRKPISEDWPGIVQHCYKCLCNLCISFDTDLKEIREANIAKLSKRYSGGKYSNEAAQARADKEGSET